ncbi:L-threonylcarbamoyladenylate synthase [Vulgatibacter incomptus]|uniref:Threonylcarbamoyl-AMP synthase n=1 Tax=Vulgatibacter incomptus TaxID=1391653 RepID=A0A0K1P9U5_9BACT|nr:L-threonylcarbamoyladenylate synthase [Vulgatibacter incomptus]AKU90285.1 hypothetical protein AKJ08_0672 [Vulgatibacter incomptus]
METELLSVVAGSHGREAIARAASLLRAGRLVAFPTETVYGLGALALDPAAVAGIFAAKGRPSFNPLIVHVASIEAAKALVREWDDRAQAFAEAFWPGPLTLVLEKAPSVPDAITAGLGAVAIRIPAHPVALALLEEVGAPVAAPSANLYTTISPTTAAHVLKSLGGRIDAILDGGATPIGIESTVLDLTGSVPVLLRPGAVGAEELSRSFGPLGHPSAMPEESSARVSPGQARKHYAPAGRVRSFSSPESLGGLLAGLGPGARAGVIARSARPEWASVAAWLQLPDDPAGFARQLYGALHALEDAGATDFFLEEVPASAAWDGVRDRLSRAAG